MIDEEVPTPSTPPTTNDDTPILPVAGLMVLSLAGTTVVGVKKRKLKKDNKK
jgi:LPXTG-motif cell wall-anchored protein